MNKKIRSVRIKGKSVTIVCQPGNSEDFIKLEKLSQELGKAEIKTENGGNNLDKLTVTFTEPAHARALFEHVTDLLYT